MNYIQLAAFFILAIFLSASWSKVLFCKRTRFENTLTIYLVTVSRLSEREAHALLKSFAYYCYGIIASLILLYCFDIDVISMFTIDKKIVTMILLGTMAELSTIRLFTSLYAITHSNVDISNEIREVSWIEGISKLPHKFIPFAPIGGAFVEEFFFRGSLLMIFIQKMSIPPYISLLVITALFAYEQLLFLKTSVQKIIIGSASVGISLMGGLLILYTGSLLPAMIAHASFVMFYFGEMSILD